MDGATFPDNAGESMSLDVAHLNATDNDDGTYWSNVTFTYGSDGQLGTPGGVNNQQLSAGLNEIEGFSIYPNPVSDAVFVLYTQNATMKQLELFNVLGKKVYLYTFSGTRSSIHLPNINAGIYILKVKEGNNVSTRKLVIK